ncbi:MAG: hypothetical protein FWF53_00175 [Candidatus Azobacteroides sp.]|nr:hypothetical protein [Candidatus Azobacteroides sp.]
MNSRDVACNISAIFLLTGKMKKTVLILIMAISVISGIAQDQLPGIYYISDINNNRKIDCYLALYNDGSYDLELSERATVDIVQSAILSHGKYFLKDNQINFLDSIHGFKMQMRLFMQKDIKVEKGFGFLEDKIFIRCYDNDNPNYINLQIEPEKQKTERYAYQKSHKTLYPIYYGTYESLDNTYQDDKYGIYETGRSYELQIKKEENKYLLYYKQILISEGTWKRDRNELSLFDENLQHSFYVLITEKGLISKYLPGEYKSCSLIYKIK